MLTPDNIPYYFIQNVVAEAELLPISTDNMSIAATADRDKE
jgi:hypothetical protein